jgi:U2 small nuclear ribonucleoprotein B''
VQRECAAVSHCTPRDCSGKLTPSRSVYVKNLEERIKPEALRESLTEIFSEYGEIIDIVAKQNLKAKGQAFIVFENAESAAKAIEEVQGFEMFGKEMKLDFARTRSDATVLHEEGDAGLERWKRGRLAEKERKQAMEVQMSKLKRPAQTTVVTDRPSKAVKGAGLKPAGGNASAVIPDEYLPPNKILFLRELPLDYDVEGLSRIFSRFEGFKEVRMVPGRPGIAFVEYEAEAGAISAKEATAGMQLGDESKAIRVTFQRQ